MQEITIMTWSGSKENWLRSNHKYYLQVSFLLEYEGDVIIDWGDGSPITHEKCFCHDYLEHSKCYKITITSENITGFISDNCELKSFNASKNPMLEKLWCFNNQLTELDIRNNHNLKELKCHGNNLQCFYLNDNPLLEDLDVSKYSISNSDYAYNQLMSLDVKNNPLLKKLKCSGHWLEDLDVSKNFELIELDCSNNQLTNLNVINNKNLKYLDCSRNNLNCIELDKLFETLPSISNGEINISSNPCANKRDRNKVAEAKGWSVISS